MESTELTTMKLTTMNASILLQLEDVLSQLDSIKYTSQYVFFSGSSIGQHVRHILEFYTCLLVGIDEKVVSYDKRKRELLLEQDPARAIFVLHETVAKLSLMRCRTEIQLEIQGENWEPSLITTTLERELLYVLEHTIHHMAILKIGFHLIPEKIDIPKNFGVAPSTIRYKNTCAQ